MAESRGSRFPAPTRTTSRDRDSFETAVYDEDTSAPAPKIARTDDEEKSPLAVNKTRNGKDAEESCSRVEGAGPSRSPSAPDEEYMFELECDVDIDDNESDTDTVRPDEDTADVDDLEEGEIEADDEDDDPLDDASSASASPSSSTGLSTASAQAQVGSSLSTGPSAAHAPVGSNASAAQPSAQAQTQAAAAVQPAAAAHARAATKLRITRTIHEDGVAYTRQLCEHVAMNDLATADGDKSVYRTENIGQYGMEQAGRDLVTEAQRVLTQHRKAAQDQLEEIGDRQARSVDRPSFKVDTTDAYKQSILEDFVEKCRVTDIVINNKYDENLLSDSDDSDS